MEWNILLFVGIALRFYYHIIKFNYPFNFKTLEGKQNIGKTSFSLILVFVTWYLCFFLHFDDYIVDGWKLVGLWVLYVVIGWSIDSLFLFLMEIGERAIKKLIGSKVPAATEEKTG